MQTKAVHLQNALKLSPHLKKRRDGRLTYKSDIHNVTELYYHYAMGHWQQFETLIESRHLSEVLVGCVNSLLEKISIQHFSWNILLSNMVGKWVFPRVHAIILSWVSIILILNIHIFKIYILYFIFYLLYRSWIYLKFTYIHNNQNI